MKRSAFAVAAEPSEQFDGLLNGKRRNDHNLRRILVA